MTPPSSRPVVATIDIAALVANLALLRGLTAPARLCVVVKADAYGHGATCIARAAEQAGVAAFAVALVEEGIALREAGITAPVLVLSEPPPEAYADAVAHELSLTLYSHGAIAHAEAAAQAARRPVTVHLKIDTGMHRVGAEPADAVELARRLAASTSLAFEGLFTHLAVADEPGDPFTALQLARLAAVRAALSSLGIAPPLTHAANSAAALAFPAARLDLVRCGIACYGYLPVPELAMTLPAGSALRPVLALSSRVHLVRLLAAGERPSYGRRYLLERPSYVATVPIGYADGVPRSLAAGGGEVLIRGKRRRLAGTVTMDQLLVDCGPEGDVEVGDEVVLIGEQGGASVGAQEWATRTGTIVHEILTSIGPRVPRLVVDSAGARPEAPPPALGPQAQPPRDGGSERR